MGLTQGPDVIANAQAGKIQPGFVVVLSRDADARSVAQSHGLTASHIYSTVLNGFAARMSSTAREALLRNPLVERVDPDIEMEAWGSQTSPPWGLDRVDQRTASLDNSYAYERTGAGVTAYVVDTGIRTSHQDFGGRATIGYDVFGEDGMDCNGHGTHVAGTIGGTTYGVAKSARLVAVRVLNCDGMGTLSGVVAGLDWVAANAKRPAVVNMSLGGGGASVLDDAIQRLADKGILSAVAAGNSGADACNYSPARAPAALTTGATTSSDSRASFSNWGACVDIFAPGASIRSAYATGNTATAVLSGTSMASPHAAGVAALILEASPSASPAQVTSQLLSQATADVVSDARSAAADLLFSAPGTTSGGGGDTEVPNAAPVADFSFSCEDLACTFTDRSADSDGTVVGWSWDFSDGTTATAENPSHSFGAAGTYTVRLQATDNDGATDVAAKDVEITVADPDVFSLQVTGSKNKGRHVLALSWTGSAADRIDVFVDRSRVATTSNSGAYEHQTDNKGKGSYTVQVCEAGSAVCSNEVVVTY